MSWGDQALHLIVVPLPALLAGLLEGLGAALGAGAAVGFFIGFLREFEQGLKDEILYFLFGRRKKRRVDSWTDVAIDQTVTTLGGLMYGGVLWAAR
jgi:hypothetical protein